MNSNFRSKVCIIMVRIAFISYNLCLVVVLIQRIYLCYKVMADICHVLIN